MKKIILFLVLSLIINNLHAKRLDSIVNVENNTDTAYYGGYRTISPHNNSYVPIGLPFNLRPKYDTSKPSFRIEDLASDVQSKRCSNDENPYTYRVFANDGKNYDFPVCVPSYNRAFIYVVINPDYSVTLNFEYGLSFYAQLFKHMLQRK